MRNRLWPWVILVPRRDGAKEIHHLPAPDRTLLMEEVATVSVAMEEIFGPDKLNIGALGNVVPQLHVHVIARRIGDPAWPGPVWGAGFHEEYGADELAETVARLNVALG